jgi:hypothetical protein
MPKKNSLFKCPDRDYVFNMTFYKKNLVEENKVKLSFTDCKNIIDTCNKNIAKVIENEVDGFKLPNGLGYLTVVSYVPCKDYVDHHNTKKIGKKVYHLNLHTSGKACKVKWFGFRYIRLKSMTSFLDVYKFKSYKTMSQSVSKAFKFGKDYVNWTVNDFINKGRLENLYDKKYRKKVNF